MTPHERTAPKQWTAFGQALVNSCPEALDRVGLAVADTSENAMACQRQRTGLAPAW